MRLVKKITAVVLAVIISFSVVGCAKDGYENLGSEREVTSKTDEEDNKNEDETVLQDVFADGSKSFSGTAVMEYYEKDSTEPIKSSTVDVTLELDQYQNAKFSNGKAAVILDNNNLRVYYQTKDDLETKTGTKYFDFYLLSVIKSTFLSAAKQAMVENGIYKVRDDGKAVIIEANNETLAQTIYRTSDILTEQYDKIYTETKDNTELLSWLTENYGSYYDFSYGIPSGFIDIYMETISDIFGQYFYFNEDDTIFNLSFMVENVDDKPVIMFLFVAENETNSVSIQGELNYLDNECEDIDIPEVIKEAEVSDSSSMSSDSVDSETPDAQTNSLNDLEMPETDTSDTDNSTSDLDSR